LLSDDESEATDVFVLLVGMVMMIVVVMMVVVVSMMLWHGRSRVVGDGGRAVVMR